MRYLKEFYRFLKHIIASRQLLFTLVLNDFKKQYLGSYFGLAWAFIQPITFIVVIWFVFEKGLRGGSPLSNGTPFFLWLICGMIPWFFFSNAVSSASNAVTANAFLVKKVSFRVGILPLIPLGSAFLIHCILVLLLAGVFLFHGFFPTIYWLQLPYYMVCSVFLMLGIAWLTSALRVFIKDVNNIVSLLLQIGFWGTPIFWQLESLPEKYQYVIQLNPLCYIIQGYRNTFIYHTWFWERINVSLYFLTVTAVFLVTGSLVFKRLRPHFGDVL